MSIKRIAVLAVCGVLAIALVVLCTFYFAGRRNYSPVNLAVDNDSLSSDKDNAGDDDLSLVEINADNVQSVIGTLKRPESYLRSLTVTNYWAGGSAQYDINVLAVPEKTGIVIKSAFEKDKHIVVSKDNVYIWYAGGSEYFSGLLGSGDNEFQSASDEYQMIPDYEEIMSIDKSQIEEARYVNYDGINCIYLRVASRTEGCSQVYYISVDRVDRGLLVAAEKYDDTFLVYKMSSDVSTDMAAGAGTDLSSGEEYKSYFTLPDGSVIS